MKVPLVLTLFASALCAMASGYHVVGQIQAGGEGGWDYLTVDSSARRIYASHATKVVVLNADTGSVAGEIPDTPGVHGIAIASGLNRGYVSCGRANNVTVFELKTLQTLDHIPTGQNPDSIVYDAPSGMLFTFNGRSHDASQIDPRSDKVLATIPLGGKPEFSVSDGKGKVYVNMEDPHEIAEMDARRGVVTKRYLLAGCEEPSGLAMDVKHRRLFSVCANKVMVISDPDASRVVATLPIGQGPDGAAFDPDRQTAFSSNGDGTLTVVRERSGRFEVLENVPTQRGARTIAVDLKTHRLYLPTADFGPLPAVPASGARRRPPIVPNTFRLLVVAQ